MQGWKSSRIASGLMGLLGDATAPVDVAERFGELRTAMKQLVVDVAGSKASSTPVFLKLNRTTEIEGLWFIRPELMLFLSTHLGEEQSMEKLRAVTALFDGLVPAQRAGKPKHKR
jgi:hypothetical protein